jgi:hypothetical protein
MMEIFNLLKILFVVQSKLELVHEKLLEYRNKIKSLGLFIIRQDDRSSTEKKVHLDYYDN